MRLLGIVVISIMLQLGIHHIPATQALFQIDALSLMDCALGLFAGTVPMIVIEGHKIIKRLMRPRQDDSNLSLRSR